MGRGLGQTEQGHVAVDRLVLRTQTFTEGLEGEYLSIQLVEVVDPADYLFTAAGYRLQEGERSVVVHTDNDPTLAGSLTDVPNPGPA